MLLLPLGGSALAHQWTPTYPSLKTSYMDGVLKVDMELFNSRQDIEYYEFSVFDKDWVPIKFATSEVITRVPYLTRKKVEIYIREQDRYVATYICSRSKIRATDTKVTIVSSRICSKVK